MRNVEAPDGPSRTKSDEVAEALREEIIAGLLEPGARLQQDELAQRFRTSITPVREALKRLEAEGLLTGRAHRGVTVASVDVEQITSIFNARRQIEPVAALRAATRLTRRDLDRARAVNDDLATAYADGDEARARTLNKEFHFVFYRGSELPTLIQEVERWWAAFPWASLQTRGGRARDSEREHREMLEAVAANDAEAIRTRFEAHIERGFLALMQQVGGEPALPDPFDQPAR